MHSKVFKSLLPSVVLTLLCILAPSSFVSANPCAGDLTVLDKAVIGVLNDFAAMIVENQNTASSEALSVVMRESLFNKFNRLEDSFKDETIREAAAQYLRERITELTQSDDRDREQTQVSVNDARRQERLQFGQYELLPLTYGFAQYETDIALSGDVLQITSMPGTSPAKNQLTFKNLFTDEVRNLHLSRHIGDVWNTKHDPKNNRAFIADPHHLYVVHIPENFDENSIAEVKVLIDLSPENGMSETRTKIKAAFAAIHKPFDFDKINIPGYLFRLKSSRDGNIFAGTVGNNIVIFNVATESFTVIEPIGFKATGITSQDWSLSPDGRYVALGSQRDSSTQSFTTFIYDTSNGKHVKSFTVETVATAFSHDGQWIVGNHGKERVVMKNLFHNVPNIELVPKDRLYDRFTFSPDDSRVFGFTRNFIDVWKSDGTFQQTIKLPPDGVERIEFADDGEYLLLFTPSLRVEIAQLKHPTQSPENTTRVLKGARKHG